MLPPSTGLPSLDDALDGVRLGDNIVFEVESLDDYLAFVRPFCAQAATLNVPFIYFRFARHPELVDPAWGLRKVELFPERGFETFIADIHRTIDEAGPGAYYVFDSISELAVDWSSDRMVGNFFMLTCPYLFRLDTVTYFAVIRNLHSFRALQPITQTTQLFLQVYRHDQRLFLHPHKVDGRYTPTMYMLHAWNPAGDGFDPVLDSATTAQVLRANHWSGLNPARHQFSIWDRVFIEAEELLESTRNGRASSVAEQEIRDRILRMMISRDARMLALAEKYLDLAELLATRNRLIGSGLIGGKAVGMLLARAILLHDNPEFAGKFEPHDSFFIGSDVFYTFLVQNGCWGVRAQQRDPEKFLEGAEDARNRILAGTFPEYLNAQLLRMLEYFGQAPIIVRSSSLLEDNFGNAFAGKYDSVFCANQGSIEERFEKLTGAIRTVYASTMSEPALAYRAHRGLLARDEQMALLVQRVSGSFNDHLFYPHLAGVGLSFNPYSWSEQIDPAAGVMRLVFGLGTRAVDRVDDDYTRIVALNAPDRRPEHNFDQIRQYTQRKVDLIDCRANEQVTRDFDDVRHYLPPRPLELFTTTADDGAAWLTFDRLLDETDFVAAIHEILDRLQQAYDYPVELEFAANFRADGDYRINLLQCRPLQVQGGGTVIQPPENVEPRDIIFEANGAVIGQSRSCAIDRIIYVVPEAYAKLPLSERYGVARRVGKLVRLSAGERQILLIGPGRWGTRQPELGVSVNFAEINGVAVLCEIVAMHASLSPEVSLGTHFFNELVESGMLYLALFPDKAGNALNEDFFAGAQNRLQEILPAESQWSDAIKVIDAETVRVFADTLKQSVLCYKVLKSIAAADS